MRWLKDQFTGDDVCHRETYIDYQFLLTHPDIIGKQIANALSATVVEAEDCEIAQYVAIKFYNGANNRARAQKANRVHYFYSTIMSVGGPHLRPVNGLLPPIYDN